MYVIFGATGHTGSRVADKLLDAGKKVRAVGRDPKRLEQFAQRGAETFIGSVEDPEAMTLAMNGAKAVYVMIPGNFATADPVAREARIIDATATAVERNGVKYVVLVSSVGAELTEGTGPVVGLHNMEERLNRIAGANVLSLRPNYFMENTLMTAGVIRQMGINGALLSPQNRFNMVATSDVADAAAELLLKLDFTGKQFRDVAGPEDISMAHVTKVIGQIIGKPDLPYMKFRPEDVEGPLTGMGATSAMAKQLIEMWQTMDAGKMKSTQQPPDLIVGPTSFTQFAQEHAAAFRS